MSIEATHMSRMRITVRLGQNRQVSEQAQRSRNTASSRPWPNSFSPGQSPANRPIAHTP